MNWIKAKAIDPGMTVAVPDDRGRSPRGEVVWTETIDPAVMRIDFRALPSTWVHPEEKLEVFPADEADGDIRASVGGPACDLIVNR